MAFALIHEAKLIGLKEGLKAGLVWILFYSFLCFYGRRDLVKVFYAAMIISVLAGIAIVFVLQEAVTAEITGTAITLSFAVLLVLSCLLLLNESGRDVTRPVLPFGNTLSSLITALLGIAFFLPDMTGFFRYLADLAY